jgi:hypothetical protein
MTFQSFCGPEELLDKLMERYDAPAHIDQAVVKKVRLRVCVAIRDFINVRQAIALPFSHLARIKCLDLTSLGCFVRCQRAGALHLIGLPGLRAGDEDQCLHQ